MCGAQSQKTHHKKDIRRLIHRTDHCSVSSNAESFNTNGNHPSKESWTLSYEPFRCHRPLKKNHRNPKTPILLWMKKAIGIQNPTEWSEFQRRIQKLEIQSYFVSPTVQVVLPWDWKLFRVSHSLHMPWQRWMPCEVHWECIVYYRW